MDLTQSFNATNNSRSNATTQAVNSAFNAIGTSQTTAVLPPVTNAQMNGLIGTDAAFLLTPVLPQTAIGEQWSVAIAIQVDVLPQNLVGTASAEAIFDGCHNYHDRCAGLISCCDLKRYFNLAVEVPDSFLNIQIHNACIQLYKDTAIPEKTFPTSKVFEWQDAQRHLAYAFALPHLNAFTLSGAARATGLASQLDARFFAPAEVEAMVKILMARYRELVKVLRWSLPAEVPNPYNSSFWFTDI